jgi:peroxiredoxin family protein
MQNVSKKIQAINAAQNAFATIESIRPGAISQETKVLLAELKVDLMDIQDAQSADKKAYIYALADLNETDFEGESL